MSRISTAKKDKIVLSVLAEIPFDGWTDSALQRGVAAVGLREGEAGLLFPQGIRDVIEHFGVMIDRAMFMEIKKTVGFDRKRVRDKIAMAVQAHLAAMGPHRQAVRRLAAWYTLPHHALAGLRRTYDIVDMIWELCGDTSTDFNFYTKRMLLAAVYKATLLYWLNDETEACQATSDFLDRRIGAVMKLGKGISFLKEMKPNEIVDLVKSRLKRA